MPFYAPHITAAPTQIPPRAISRIRQIWVDAPTVKMIHGKDAEQEVRCSVRSVLNRPIDSDATPALNRLRIALQP